MKDVISEREKNTLMDGLHADTRSLMESHSFPVFVLA